MFISHTRTQIYIYICVYIYIYTYIHIYTYIYICSPPTRTYLFFYFIDCFIARSTICYLLSAKNTQTQKTQSKHKNKNNALESLLPSSIPK